MAKQQTYITNCKWMCEWKIWNSGAFVKIVDNDSLNSILILL